MLDRRLISTKLLSIPSIAVVVALDPISLIHIVRISTEIPLQKETQV
jgi:hypothetical protein